MMKKFIIGQIAKQYRARVTKAKTVQVRHLTYMFGYTMPQLVKTYLKACRL